LSRDLLESELFGHERGAYTGATGSKPGLLEVADRGTVFLDEIGDMDPLIQAKLLTVLDEKWFRRLGEVRDRRVDIRLVAATNQDLTALVHERKFRNDLYFRINALPLTVPALRERKEDIIPLAGRIFNGLARDLGRSSAVLSPEAEAALEQYSWPGNVRELKNVLERALLLTTRNVLLPRDLRFESLGESEGLAGSPSMTLTEVERLHIERVLGAERGNVERAAARLGVSRSSLYEKIKRYRLSWSRS
jgi:transcriptional regulator with PAS, ATPase and Fis domain